MLVLLQGVVACRAATGPDSGLAPWPEGIPCSQQADSLLTLHELTCGRRSDVKG